MAKGRAGPSRRAILGTAAALAAAPAGAPLAALAAIAARLPHHRPPSLPLRPGLDPNGLAGLAAKRFGLQIFAMDDNAKWGAPRRDPEYLSLLRSQFYGITVGQALNFVRAEPNPGAFTFADAAEVLDDAKAAGMRFRNHCVCWDVGTPGWLKDLGPEALDTALATFLETVFAYQESRYPGLCSTVVVVNEAMANGSNSVADRKCVWSRLGPDPEYYIVRAFQLAKQLRPGYALCLNDYAQEYPGYAHERARAFRALVQRLLDRGAPIDVVGFQCHVRNIYKEVPTYDGLMEVFGWFDALGLPCHLTEVDYDVKLAGDVPAQLQAEARMYGDVILRAALDSPNVTNLTLWGFTDKFSSVAYDCGPAYGAGLPWDEFYRPKLALRAMMERLGRAI